MAKGGSSKKTWVVAALVVAGVAGAALFLGGACKDSEQAGRDTRRTVEKGKELLKEGLDATKDAAKTGIEKGTEAAREGLDKTKEAAEEFKKGWNEEKKK